MKLQRKALYIYIFIVLLVILMLYAAYTLYISRTNSRKLNVGVLISTCKHYFENVYTLIRELKDSGFKAKDILVVSGQEDADSEIKIDGVKVVKVRYTGLNLTGLIYVNEHMSEYRDKDYWINLPCTITIGPNFGSIILNRLHVIGPNKIIPFINPKLKKTMDMGIIPTGHIIEIGDYLKKMKLTEYTKEDINNLKLQLIYDEDLLFCLPATDKKTPVTFIEKCEKPIWFFVNDKTQYSEFIEEVEGKKILVTHLKTLDFKKYQRNFKGPSSNFVLEL